jgi:hypothetical protein
MDASKWSEIRLEVNGFLQGSPNSKADGNVPIEGIMDGRTLKERAAV